MGWGRCHPVVDFGIGVENRETPTSFGRRHMVWRVAVRSAMPVIISRWTRMGFTSAPYFGNAT